MKKELCIFDQVKNLVSQISKITMKIGLMELNDEEVGLPLRGNNLPLKIAKNADYRTLLDAAVKKTY